MFFLVLLEAMAHAFMPPYPPRLPHAAGGFRAGIDASESMDRLHTYNHVINFACLGV